MMKVKLLILLLVFTAVPVIADSRNPVSVFNDQFEDKILKFEFFDADTDIVWVSAEPGKYKVTVVCDTPNNSSKSIMLRSSLSR